MTRVHVRLHLQPRTAITGTRYQGHPVGMLTHPFFSASQWLLLRDHFVSLSSFSTHFLRVRGLFTSHRASLRDRLPRQGILAQRQPVRSYRQADRRPFSQFIKGALHVFQVRRNSQIFTSSIPRGSQQLSTSYSMKLCPDFFNGRMSDRIFTRRFGRIITLKFTISRRVRPRFLLRVSTFFSRTFSIFVMFNF